MLVPGGRIGDVVALTISLGPAPNTYNCAGHGREATLRRSAVQDLREHVPRLFDCHLVDNVGCRQTRSGEGETADSRLIAEFNQLA